MLFAFTRSNLLKQLPDQNGTLLQLAEIVTVSNSNKKNFLELLYSLSEFVSCKLTGLIALPFHWQKSSVWYS